MGFKEILLNLPEVVAPTEKRLPFKEKLKWTFAVLVIFYILGLIPLFGLGKNALGNFQLLSLILGAEFGSIISLGIGPIVTASILLQLLNGSGIIKFDLTNPENKRMFQGVQKALALGFVVFEAMIYVFSGGLSPAQGISQFTIIFQLILGGVLILMMDEVVSKWGFGQGVSLFIAAGISKEIIVRLLSPLSQSGDFAFSTGQAPIGAIPAIFYFFSAGDLNEVAYYFVTIITTLTVFAIAVFAQSMKVEVPLSFGRIRGHGIRWPLSFLYTSNIPVILTAALLANIQLWTRLLNARGIHILGTLDSSGVASTGFVAYISSPNLIRSIFQGVVQPDDFLKAVTYAIFLMAGAVVFSVFWVKTAGMDARSQAENMMKYGLQIPGFRRDERVLESLLNRYIPPLTVLGGLTIGLLAAFADIAGTLSSGTGLLLTVMIIYRLYEDIAQHHAMDMNPMLRKFMEK